MSGRNVPSVTTQTATQPNTTHSNNVVLFSKKLRTPKPNAMLPKPNAHCTTTLYANSLACPLSSRFANFVNAGPGIVYPSYLVKRLNWMPGSVAL